MGVQPSTRQIGKYTVIDVIGAGGMGIVFRAQDPTIGRTVAIKMLKHRESGDTQNMFDRFFAREMKSTGNLHHKNIVTVYDSGEHEGNPYLVMEYLEGEPVSRLISERRPMLLLEKLDLIIQVCDGLQYAHDRNVIHRDIKPANVIFLADGTAKIVDFGVARVAGSETSLAQTGQLVGSLSYMSPEQINSLPLDGRSDIFSTGVMLYELLTYEVPFKGTDPSSTFVRILREDPLPLSRYIPDIPAAMQTVINRALAKSVQDRYQSAEEFGFDMLAIQKDMKTSTAADFLKRAEAAMQRGDLDRSRVLLQDVIRLDRHNERANRLLREIRQAIQQQQRSSQVVQIRSQAQVALAGGQYEEALACADQALRLDPADTDSIQLCDQIRNAISRAKSVREALNRAETALFAGDIDEAKDAVEESLRLDPSDSEARALASMINKELSERFRRHQVQEFVDQARQGIAERKFSDALDALHRAEELDPTDSNVRELLQWAQRGQEQENRRRYLQDITDQIEKALHGGDFSSACTISDMGLQRFPGEPTLIRLRAISEKQRDIADRRRFVHDESLAVKALTDEDKLPEAVQVLTAALRKFPGEPNLESLLAITKAAIERQQFEREEAARRKAMQRAETEARAQLTQQVLNWSVDLRRSLDARTALSEIAKISKDLRAVLESKPIDDHAREVAGLVLNELNGRLRARDQAIVELEQLQRSVERSQDAFYFSETENRLLSIKSAFPNEADIQRVCAELANSIARLRDARERSIATLSDLAQTLETTPTSELKSLQDKARSLAAGIASDPRVGALLQQIDSAVSRRFERRAELVRDMGALSGSLAKVHSLDEIARIGDRASAIAALDPTDDELADRARKVEAEAGRIRDTMESLLRDMAALSRAAANAPTVHDADAVVSQVRELSERRSDFQTLQEAATRVLAEIQGRRIEYDLIVQELESALGAIPLLETDEELVSSASRASYCREQHGGESAIVALSDRIEAEVKRILRERAEQHARKEECDNAIHTSEERLRSLDLQGSLDALLTVEAQNPDRVDLHLQISLIRRALEQQRLEQEQLDQEQRAREQAEAELQARRAAVAEAIQAAQRLLDEGKNEESVQCLHTALEHQPGEDDLESALQSTLAEVARRRAEQERIEQERLAREKAEAEARARKEAAEQAIQEGWELLAQGRSGEALQCLRSALERDHGNEELESAQQLVLEEIARQRAEQERIEQERLGREKAEAEARARKEAADRAIKEGRALLAQGKNGESEQCLRSALERDPGNEELQSELQSALAEVARQHAELERRAREEAEAQARKGAAERAIEEARRLLAEGQGDESERCLRSALERDPGRPELESALEKALPEVARQREERERLAREAAEAQARKEAAEQAIQEAMQLLAQGQHAESLQCLRSALERDAQAKNLQSTLESVQGEIERQRKEREREERERAKREQLEREKAEAEAKARKAAADQAIERARKLFAKGRNEESIQCLSDALRNDGENAELRSALESMQAEVTAQRLEAERLAWEQREQERKAREKAEAEARERKAAVDRAIQDARELLASGRGEAAVQRVHSALQAEPQNPELLANLESIQGEIARQRAEQERLEHERLERERIALERERIAKEKAAAEARARQAASEQAMAQAQKLLAQDQEAACLECLRNALGRDAENGALRAALESASAEIDGRRAERERLERERLERDRIAKEKAEAEARARQTAADEAIREARALLAQARGEESVQRLRGAIEKDPAHEGLRSALESVQGEIARQRAEQERLERERVERERIAKEKAESEARARKAAADKAIKEARELLAQKRGADAVQSLRAALGRDADNRELQAEFQSTESEAARLRAEQEQLERERQERERIAKEKAAAEARARLAAAQEAIKEARALLAQGRGEESAQRLRLALEKDSTSGDLRATLESVQAEIGRQRAEQERQERERREREQIAREKAEAEARARKGAADKAIKEARVLLAQKRGADALQCLRVALGRDADNKELQSELQSVETEAARQRAEQEQLERERLERERIAKEKAAAEARARQAAAEQAIKEARALLSEGRADESVQRLRAALESAPKNSDLRSTLDSVQVEIARQRAEQKRLERERAKEQAAEEARARKAEAEKKKAEAARLGAAAAASKLKPAQAGLLGDAAKRPRREVLIAAAVGGTLVLAAVGYGIVKLVHPPPPPPMSTVTFTVDPPDSALSVDGNATKCPGNCVLKLTPGRHTVRSEKVGFVADQIEITVATPPEASDPEHLVLKPIPVHGSPLPSLAIYGDLGSGSVTVDGDSKGSLSGRLDLGELTQGSHRVEVTENHQRLDIPLQVSQQGTIKVEGAFGLEQNAVVAVTQNGNDGAIFCRCAGAELQIDGKKPKPAGRDRYSFSARGKTEFELTLVRAGKTQSTRIQGADAMHAVVLIQRPIQVAPPPTPVATSSGPAQPLVTSPTIAPSTPQASAQQPPPQTPPAPTPKPPQQVTADPEPAAWNLVNKNDINALKEFRAHFPTGQHAKVAYERMEELSWEAVKNSNQILELQRFVEQYPDSRHVSDANGRIQELVKEQSLLRDRDAIKQALESYRSAYERKDLNALQEIWPSVPRAKFQQTFKAADKISVSLTQQQPVINGDTATVSCVQDLMFVVGGKKSQFHESRLFHLRRDGGRWIIEKDN